MLSKVLFPFSIAIILLSCQQKIDKEIVELPALRASSIYNQDSVSRYIGGHNDNHKIVAESYFNKGKEIKATDSKKAAYFFKRAITLYPTLEAYKELGQSLLSAGFYKDAAQLYSFLLYPYKYNGDTAIYIFQAPDFDIFYGEILSQYLANSYIDIETIWIARDDAGIKSSELKDKFLSNEFVHFDTASIEYKNILLKFLTEEEIESYKSSESTFKNLLSSIKDTSAIFEINEKQVQQFTYNMMDYWDGPTGVDLSDLYIYFLKEKQENPKDHYFQYNLTHFIKENDSVLTVIYSVDNSEEACPIEMRNIYHHLVTYTNKGKIIDSKVVANQSGPELSTLKFEADHFTIKNYKRHWKKEYDNKDFDNEITNTELTGSKDFKILPDGHIEEAFTQERL